MQIVLIISTAILALALVFFLSLRRRYNAAMNVIMARYTFDRLNRNQQAQIKEVAQQLVKQRGLNIEGYAHDVERYGWYAQAMRQLSIPSKLPENPKWHVIANPTKALKRRDFLIGFVSGLVKQHYSIDIQLS
ncbi:MAG: hypothetical protein OEZ43_11115 [Gammaproteobacteria bacterium]|nr:hypothetical protein [Gammaproteobacteria bacterium]